MADDQTDQNLFGSPLDATFATEPPAAVPAPPAPSYPPPSYAPPSYPAPGYAPSGNGFEPGYPATAPAADGYPVMADPPKRGLPRRTIVLICVAVGLVVLAMVAAAIAEDSKHQPAARAVTMPTSVLGWPQMHSTQLDAIATRQISALDGYYVLKNPQAGFFGNGSRPSVVVFVAKLSIRPDSEDVSNFFRNMASALDRPRMDNFDPGPFGGTLECSGASVDGAGATVCASLDSAAFIEVVEFTTDEAAVAADTREIISTAEH